MWGWNPKSLDISYICRMGIEISLLFPSAFLIGVEYFKSNYPGEHQEIDFNLGVIRVTIIW